MNGWVHTLTTVHTVTFFSDLSQINPKIRLENFRGHWESTILTSRTAQCSQACLRKAMESGGGADGIDYRNKV